jgi:hypothetical protein
VDEEEIEKRLPMERRATYERKTACKATAQDALYKAMFLFTRRSLRSLQITRETKRTRQPEVSFFNLKEAVATATLANDANFLVRYRATRARMRERRRARAQNAERRREAFLRFRRKTTLKGSEGWLGENV